MKTVKYKRVFVGSDKVQEATLINPTGQFINWLNAISAKKPGIDIPTGKEWYPIDIRIIETKPSKPKRAKREKL
jgi:hypothetical protein